MIYAASKDGLRKKLDGVYTEIQCTDLSEVSHETVLDKVFFILIIGYAYDFLEDPFLINQDNGGNFLTSVFPVSIHRCAFSIYENSICKDTFYSFLNANTE